MPYIKFGRQNEGPIEIHYHDHGSGQPVVLVHGWPLSERSWEMQEPALLERGFRVIKYDRRGFGESSKPVQGYDYNTMAADLNELMTQLDLQNAILVGFSMGAGEVARYLGTYGSSRVAKAVFIAGITPFLLKTDENPEGADQKLFDDIIENIKKDRPAFLRKFLFDFYSHNMMGTLDVSQEVVDFSWAVAVMASPIGTVKCVSAWLEDFRTDLSRVKIPTLVIHGDKDKIIPIAVSGARMQSLIEDCQFVELKNAPHGVLVSHADEVNSTLLQFFGQPQMQQRSNFSSTGIETNPRH